MWCWAGTVRSAGPSVALVLWVQRRVLCAPEFYYAPARPSLHHHSRVAPIGCLSGAATVRRTLLFTRGVRACIAWSGSRALPVLHSSSPCCARRGWCCLSLVLSTATPLQACPHPWPLAFTVLSLPSLLCAATRFTVPALRALITAHTLCLAVGAVLSLHCSSLPALLDSPRGYTLDVPNPFGRCSLLVASPLSG